MRFSSTVPAVSPVHANEELILASHTEICFYGCYAACVNCKFRAAMRKRRTEMFYLWDSGVKSCRLSSVAAINCFQGIRHMKLTVTELCTFAYRRY